MDMTAFLMGLQAGKKAGGGDAGGGIKYVAKSVTLTGNASERVSVDFGFKPDFLLVWPSGVTHTNYKNILYAGISDKFAAVVGVSAFTQNVYCGSSTTTTEAYFNAIDSDITGGSINRADETGFNVGRNASPGRYTVYAIGI